MNLTLIVQHLESDSFIPSDEEFSTWIQAVLAAHKKNAEIVIRLTGMDESAQLNQLYRGKAKPTNILSFGSVLPPDFAKDNLHGDLVVCVPLVRQEAESENIPLLSHWAHLIVHGCMHLLGHDHEQDDEADRMEKLETDVMICLGFDDPYK